MPTPPRKTIPRDISWLSFNARVLQEAADPSVPLKDKIRFMGIFSNNLDEFFRVRVAALKRMIKLGARSGMHLEESPQQILDDIQVHVLQQQGEFNRIWQQVVQQLRREKIFIVTETQLNKEQKRFVSTFFEAEVRRNVIPLMIENIPEFPYLRDKSIYLAVVMSRKSSAYARKYALIEVPTRAVDRFIIIPSGKPDEKHIILLEDVIRFNLPRIFSFFEYDEFSAHVVKVTKDAEYDIDYDETSSYTDKIEKGIRNRRKGKPVRFIYDKEIEPALLEYLIRRMGLSKRDHLIPGGRIHNFRHFMDFPDSVFSDHASRRKPFIHPDLTGTSRITDVILKKDLMLSFPYHSFDPMIDMLREAAIDPDVVSIKITAYRLAKFSKIVNALINAVRNGKKVEVMLELRARFDEENNILWKQLLEEEGVKVLVGIPKLKVHAKICLITKKKGTGNIHYGFVSTGNLNESTARVYGDHCLLTSDKSIMADVSRIFRYIENPKTGLKYLRLCKTVLASPYFLRREMQNLIMQEIRNAKAGQKAEITLKMNSLSDDLLISKLYEAAAAGVRIRMVIRGIFCAYTEKKKFSKPIQAVSIVDEYLEHARVLVFHNRGKEKVFISSADFMVRNLDHRVEAAVPIKDPKIARELKDILEIQFMDNVKARVLDNKLSNAYQESKGRKIRSQTEIYNYLYRIALANRNPVVDPLA
jgi:polyphosphate kinase